MARLTDAAVHLASCLEPALLVGRQRRRHRCPGLARPAHAREQVRRARAQLASARRELRQRRRLLFHAQLGADSAACAETCAREVFFLRVGIRSAGPCPAAGAGRAWRPRRRRTGTRWRRSRHRRTQQRDFRTAQKRGALPARPARGAGPVEEPLDGAVLAAADDRRREHGDGSIPLRRLRVRRHEHERMSHVPHMQIEPERRRALRHAMQQNGGVRRVKGGMGIPSCPSRRCSPATDPPS